MKASTRANALSGSGPASAGSPHRDQCISGVLGVLMCYIVTHDVNSSQRRSDRGSASLRRRRLPRRGPRGDPRRRLEPYDAHRHRAPGRGEPDDALPPVAGHPGAGRRPDDPRVGPRRQRGGGDAGPDRGPAAPDHRGRRRDRASPAGRRAAAADHRPRPRGAAALPARPPRPQPGLLADQPRRTDPQGPAPRVDPRGRRRRARAVAPAGLPRLCALRAHDDRQRCRHPSRDADVSAFDRELGHLVERFLQP